MTTAAESGSGASSNSTSAVVLGFRAHSGWAVLVAVAGSRTEPLVVDRRRIELADPDVPRPVQPYHAAQGMPFEQAREFIERCAGQACSHAEHALDAVINELREMSHDVIGCGLLVSSARPAEVALEVILASHVMIHTAEGELFRKAIVRASERHGLSTMKLKERELYSRGAEELGIPLSELGDRLASMGEPWRPPWRQDEKYAALIAWIGLSGKSGFTRHSNSSPH